ncbi:cadherin-related family member 5 [Centropristis striata]|uniref:cadherin-related family member 5 n=1 Tax=Centropristis striata TaxID=184440 RepID=UPI0027DF6200|nr:cadherin-related family member 5 [Centropristis striata]
MDGIHPHFTVRTSFSFLLLILLQTTTDAQICSGPVSVNFEENNVVGAVVTEITVQPGVTLGFKPPLANANNPFRFEGNRLIADRILDFETLSTYTVDIICTHIDGRRRLGQHPYLDIFVIVIVTNVNEHPPVFDMDPNFLTVPENSPINTYVGNVTARDRDGDPIQYRLTPDSSGFTLRTDNTPDLFTTIIFDYDKFKTVELTLYAQDSTFTASTTITVTIQDVDNRPPWFKPCTEYEIGGTLICQNTGYTGRVVLNEQEPGALVLKPGPLYAIDGDLGLNEPVTYSILSGNDGEIFNINPDTGEITMLKPALVLGNITLTVLAAQKTNSHQFATTTVTIDVQVKSLHAPQFQRPQYEAVVTGVGSMAMDPKNKDEPLKILATDEDFAGVGGINPHITYSVNSNDFTIIDGFLFMTRDLPEGTLALELEATDESNKESATAQLSVEVATGITTTALPTSTMATTVITTIGESTTNGKTTVDTVSTTIPGSTTDSSVSTTNPSSTTDSIFSTTNLGTTTERIISTTNPGLTSEGTISTTNPSPTSGDSVSTASTAPPRTVIVPSGGYGPVDMAALGATLGVLVLICLVVIVVLAVHIQKGKSAWKKIYEASMFQSSLGQGSGGKEGIQYTNQAFQNDEDGDSFGGPMGGSLTAGVARDISLNEAIVKSTVPLHALLRDDTSQTSSDKADNEKEVKPILTKERRMDEGYKSVWFKEDIDPNAKEEVVIIPDSREDDSEEEDEDDEEDNRQMKTPKVAFNDADLDSGLGVKMEDPAEDSESDEVLTVDL